LSDLHHQRTGFAHPLIGHDDDFSEEDNNVDTDADKMANDVAALHLWATDDGTVQLFGLVEVPQGATDTANLGQLAQLPPVLDRCVRFFPFSTPSGTREQAVTALRRCLPDREYAEGLLHNIFDNYAFILPAVDKHLVFVDLLPGLYDPRLVRPAHAHILEEHGDSPRAFALLYALLASAVLLDANNDDRERHAAIFGRLCHAGLGAVSIFDKPSYLSVLALFHGSIYHMMHQKELSQTGRSFTNLACQCALQVSCGGWGRHWSYSC
jgi:hypothetical protein